MDTGVSHFVVSALAAAAAPTNIIHPVTAKDVAALNATLFIKSPLVPAGWQTGNDLALKFRASLANCESQHAARAARLRADAAIDAIHPGPVSH
ncbi:MAG: hypothetical protein WBB54_06960 [Mycobacterium sp.]|jgi:hypothetical protein